MWITWNRTCACAVSRFLHSWFRRLSRMSNNHRFGQSCENVAYTDLLFKKTYRKLSFVRITASLSLVHLRYTNGKDFLLVPTMILDFSFVNVILNFTKLRCRCKILTLFVKQIDTFINIWNELQLNIYALEIHLFKLVSY